MKQTLERTVLVHNSRKIRGFDAALQRADGNLVFTRSEKLVEFSKTFNGIFLLRGKAHQTGSSRNYPDYENCGTPSNIRTGCDRFRSIK